MPLQDNNKQPSHPSDRTVFSRHDTASSPSSASRRDNGQALDEMTRIRNNNPGSQAELSRSEVAGTTNIRNRNIPDGSTRARENLAVQYQKPSHYRNGEATQIRPAGGTHKQAIPGSSYSTSARKQTLKGRFTLEKVIGVGGMGVVYKAIDRLKVEARDREPYVAIKVLSEDFKSHPESFIALQRESRKTQRIAHPNVVKVYDFDRDGDTVFMTMEYMEGVPLDQLIKQYNVTGLPRDDVWSILKGLCSALMFAHAENIVHSDFKPGNIFITDSGMPKIFDFGIARAVANIDRHSGKQKDRTVFDAGSLGALTPAYASLEMLQGKDPDARDDVYALGCIAYEMLTGEHPFNRLPADEACKIRLKPKKIPNIKKPQWRAIEKALAFRREDRTRSAEEFYNQIHPKARSVSLLASTVVVLAAIGVATYLIVTRESASNLQGNQKIDKDQIEFKVRYDFYKEKLTKLIAAPAFTEEWESSTWEVYSGISRLLDGKPDQWLQSARNQLYHLYLDHYRSAFNNREYDKAKILLSNAYRYSDNAQFLDAEMARLTEIYNKQKDAERVAAELNRKKHIKALSVTKQTDSDNYNYALALKNVNQQLECQSRLNMREFGIAIDKLRNVDLRRYTKIEPEIISTLSRCILHVAELNPDRALEDKRYALRIFDNNASISAIHIAPRDACNMSIAGLGSRGERAICRDKINGFGSDGPALVVIPGSGSIKAFAISKYEISQREIDLFCRSTSVCRVSRGKDAWLPAVNVGIGVINQYIRWLSANTKQKYRLPTRKEWVYAASASRKFVDPNRNCALNTRGIEKGGQLVRANTGVQNSWGLVNYLGNASEIVYDKSRNLIAMGGSYKNSMEDCTIGSSVIYSGSPDDATGFRVIREVSR